MNTKPLAMFFCFPVCLALASVAQAETLEQFLKGFTPKLEKAIEKADIGFFDKMTTSDYTDTENGKTSTKAEALQQMKFRPAAGAKMICKVKILSSKSAGKVGSSTSSINVQIIMKPGTDGKVHKMDMTMSQKETWVQVGSTWKLKALVASKPTMKMDGKSSGLKVVDP